MCDLNTSFGFVARYAGTILTAFEKDCSLDSCDIPTLIEYISILAESVQAHKLHKNNKMLLKLYISSIRYIMEMYPELYNTYLTYYLLVQLAQFYPTPDIESIFDKISKTEVGHAYMAQVLGNTCYNSIEYNKWRSKFIKDYSHQDRFADPITGIRVVIPCMFPESSTIYDKYVLQSYVWSKEINPFNKKQILTVEMINEYAQSDKSIYYQINLTPSTTKWWQRLI